MIKKIVLCGREIEYDLQRKKVKNINLRVKPDGSVHVSASTRVSLERIERFLLTNESFIFNAIERFKKREENTTKPLLFESGEKVTVLGESYTLSVQRGTKNLAYTEDEKLILFVRDETNSELRKKTLENYLADVCRYEVDKICRKIYPEFSETVKEYPTVKFRKMHTKWGICRPGRNEITFSYMLASAPLECIEYVVCHEFCHFYYADHSKRFYDTLASHMPDWKEKKKRLEGIDVLK
jgi:predicted metal-dependent hydrolase